MRPSDHSPISTCTSTTGVLVDPTSPDGESSLDELRDDDTYVLITTLLTGRASNALHDDAHGAGTSVTEAGWNYLDRLADRIAQPGRTVGTITAAGPDTALELAAIVTEHEADRVVFPASIVRIDRSAARRLAQAVPVEIVAPALTARITVAG